MDSDNQNRRLFVGGLTVTVTEKELRDRFKSFGTVIELERPPGSDGFRGFSYITVSMTKASLQKCIAVYAKSTWKGMKLRIEEAKPGYLERLRKERAEQAVLASNAFHEVPRSNRKRKRATVFELPDAVPRLVKTFKTTAESEPESKNDSGEAHQPEADTDASEAHEPVLDRASKHLQKIIGTVMDPPSTAAKHKTRVVIGPKRVITLDPNKYRNNHKRLEGLAGGIKALPDSRSAREPSVSDVWGLVAGVSKTQAPSHKPDVQEKPTPSKVTSDRADHLHCKENEEASKLSSQTKPTPDTTRSKAPAPTPPNRKGPPPGIFDDDDDDDFDSKTVARPNSEDAEYAQELTGVADDEVEQKLADEKKSVLSILKSMPLWFGKAGGDGGKTEPVEAKEETIAEAGTDAAPKVAENAVKPIAWRQPVRFDPLDETSENLLLEDTGEEPGSNADDDEADEPVAAADDMVTEEPESATDVAFVQSASPSQPALDAVKPAVYQVNTDLRSLVFGGNSGGGFSLFGDDETDVAVQPDDENMAGLEGDALRKRAGFVAGRGGVLGTRTRFSVLGALGDDEVENEESEEAAGASEVSERKTALESEKKDDVAGDATESGTQGFAKAKMFFLHIGNPSLADSDEITQNWEQTRRDLTLEYKRKHRSAARRAGRSTLFQKPAGGAR
ncbi:nucleolar protein 8 [Phlyctochytrium bullatum]|nr:nucleolar protein 8 [Phlyctochytrium bullatum]